MRTWFGLGVFAFAVLACVHAYDASLRERQLRHFLTDEGRGIAEIIKLHNIPLEKCSIDDSDHLHTLMRAFIIVERFATPRLPYLAKSLFVQAAVALGQDPGDMSLGPARIRASTALAAAGAVRPSSASSYLSLSRAEVISRLSTNCDAFNIGLIVLHAIALSYDQYTHVDRAFIRFATPKYGGKADHFTTWEAEISANIYFRLVYSSFQHLRFAAIPQRHSEAFHPGR